MKFNSLSLKLRFDLILKENRHYCNYSNILGHKFKINPFNNNFVKQKSIMMMFSTINDKSPITTMQMHLNSKLDNSNIDINSKISLENNINTKLNLNYGKEPLTGNDIDNNKEMIILNKYLGNLDNKIYTYLKLTYDLSKNLESELEKLRNNKYFLEKKIDECSSNKNSKSSNLLLNSEEDNNIDNDDNYEKELKKIQQEISLLNLEIDRVVQFLDNIAEECNFYNTLKDKVKEIINGDDMLSESMQLNDKNLIEMTKDEINIILEDVKNLREEIVDVLLKPKKCDKIILEIKAASGGIESAIFANDIMCVYENFCSSKGFEFKIINIDRGEQVGKIKNCKSAKIEIKGDDVLKYFEFESGVHKVQRVPITETKGRVHSSTCQVVILQSHYDDFKNDVFDERDIKFEFKKASGKGGQHVNKTLSACRLTHIPTGISVQCSDERDQHQNKNKALETIKIKINDLKISEFNNKISEYRKSQSGSGNLSEKIRTYNFPDSRVTDHRLSITKYGIEKMFNGNQLEEFIDLNIKQDKENKLYDLINSRIENLLSSSQIDKQDANNTENDSNEK